MNRHETHNEGQSKAPAKSGTTAPPVLQPIFMSVSPRDWRLEPSSEVDAPVFSALGVPKPQLALRSRNNTVQWLPRQYDEGAGAFHGFYNAKKRDFAPPQNVNLIAPFQCIAAFDRYHDEQFLHMARNCSEWLDANLVETHPMSLVMGGVLDNIKRNELWSKYAADYVLLNLSLWERLGAETYLARALQSTRFLIQSQNHGFAPKYDHWNEQWISQGWQSFGRVVAAMVSLQESTGDRTWLERAVSWADYGLSLQAENGCFYLLNGPYYNSDIAADEIRALLRMYLRTGDQRYLQGGLRFADWHLQNQRADGSWPLAEDRWGVPVSDSRGPGDMPNIAIALLLAHRTTGLARYVTAAARALRYALRQQLVPEDGDPQFASDPNALWGFWSWDPAYDYTMSADQSTHHARACWFFMDYLSSLEDRQVEDLLAAARDAGVASPARESAVKA